MTLLAAVGQARALDGREAGMQATHLALNGLSNQPPIFGLVVSSYQYDPQQVVNGVASLTGNMPLAGFSTSAGISTSGLQPHSVLVALFASADMRADVQWLAGYTQASREVSLQIAELFKNNPRQPALFFADGFNADAEQLCASLPPGTRLVGGLSSGDMHAGNAYQIGGTQFGSGGLVLARFEGNLRLGIGVGHGWQAIGTHFRVTRSRGFWVRTLDGRPASETYARLFGYPAREWAFPPLDHLARLYPLGLEQPDQSLLLRAPLRVEADGSFRMNAPVKDGTDAYLLIGSLTACRSAIERAVAQAIAGLEGARPALALVLADVSWQMLHEAQPGADIEAVRTALGSALGSAGGTEIPIIGGYTLGQVIPGGEAAPKFLNQHLVVILFGEKSN